jgi:hypothetical protein
MRAQEDVLQSISSYMLQGVLFNEVCSPATNLLDMLPLIGCAGFDWVATKIQNFFIPSLAQHMICLVRYLPETNIFKWPQQLLRGTVGRMQAFSSIGVLMAIVQPGLLLLLLLRASAVWQGDRTAVHHCYGHLLTDWLMTGAMLRGMDGREREKMRGGTREQKGVSQAPPHWALPLAALPGLLWAGCPVNMPLLISIYEGHALLSFCLFSASCCRHICSA